VQVPEIEQTIEDGAKALGLLLPSGASGKLAQLLNELGRWNARINLTAIRDVESMIAAHVLDSLSVRSLVAGRTVIDVGTGAGFPGLPLAITSPELDIMLIDSNGKKISFVRHMIGELDLPNVRAEHARVERFAPAERFDTVIARAFASLPRLLELTRHLLDDAGVLLALKGQYPAAELDELQQCAEPWDINVTKLTVPGLGRHSRHAIRIRRAPGLRQ
jgi:16S rRNA (guanine527-N7)-methyltransferase